MSDTTQGQKQITDPSSSVSLDEVLINSRTLRDREISSLVNITTTVDLSPTQLVVDDTETSTLLTSVEQPDEISFTSFTAEYCDHFVEDIANSDDTTLLPIDPYETKFGTAYFACVSKSPSIELTFKDQNATTHSASISCKTVEDAEEISEKLIRGDLEIVTTDDETKLKHTPPIHSQIPIPLSVACGLLFSLLFTPLFFRNANLELSSVLLVGSFCLLVGVGICATIAILFADLTGKYSRTYSISPNCKDPSLENYCIENSIYTESMITPNFDGETLRLECSDLRHDTEVWDYTVGDNKSFQNESVIDFYVNLGFEHSETSEKPFQAYISPLKFDDYPHLESENNNLYLYPEPPVA